MKQIWILGLMGNKGGFQRLEGEKKVCFTIILSQDEGGTDYTNSYHRKKYGVFQENIFLECEIIQLFN